MKVLAFNKRTIIEDGIAYELDQYGRCVREYANDYELLREFNNEGRIAKEVYPLTGEIIKFTYYSNGKIALTFLKMSEDGKEVPDGPIRLL